MKDLITAQNTSEAGWFAVPAADLGVKQLIVL